MEKYVLAVCGAVILSALVTILLPEGKIGKFVNGMLKVFCVFVMLVPLYNLFADFSLPAAGESSSEIELDGQFIDAVYSARAEQQAKALEETLAEEQGVQIAAEISWKCVEYAYEIEQVRVKIEDFGIYGEDEHIFVIEQVESRITELVGDKPEVIVYE